MDFFIVAVIVLIAIFPITGESDDSSKALVIVRVVRAFRSLKSIRHAKNCDDATKIMNNKLLRPFQLSLQLDHCDAHGHQVRQRHGQHSPRVDHFHARHGRHGRHSVRFERSEDTMVPKCSQRVVSSLHLCYSGWMEFSVR